MSLLDAVMSAACRNNPEFSGQARLLPVLIAQVDTYPGGLAGLIAKFQDGGLGEAMASWIGTGPNQKVTAPQLRLALGDDLVAQLAQSADQDQDEMLRNLGAMLPSLVDYATPDGVLPDGLGRGASLPKGLSLGKSGPK